MFISMRDSIGFYRSGRQCKPASPGKFAKFLCKDLAIMMSDIPYKAHLSEGVFGGDGRAL
jgi:hypothetical protein